MNFNNFKVRKLVEILQTARGTTLGLGFWSLLWILAVLLGEAGLSLSFSNLYLGMIDSVLCLILAIIYRKWRIPLVFVAVSPWVPLVLLNFIYRILMWMAAHGLSVQYPSSLLFFALILASTYFVFASFEYLLIKWSARVIPRK